MSEHWGRIDDEDIKMEQITSIMPAQLDEVRRDMDSATRRAEGTEHRRAEGREEHGAS